jgi:tRNA (cytidine/uridine-2'-O-)-methyltransferase
LEFIDWHPVISREWVARVDSSGGCGYQTGMFNIVLVEPEIPHNAGAAGRLALATGSALHLVKPLGFSLDDKYVRRTGLDYWQDVELFVWEDFSELEAVMEGKGKWLLSTKAGKPHWDVSFAPGDFLIFGKETKGLPEEMVGAAGESALRIPMAPGGTRSLNLSTAVAIVLYEALRQQSPDW